MKQELKDELEKAIERCVANVRLVESSDMVLQYSQAALNLANALVGLSSESRQK